MFWGIWCHIDHALPESSSWYGSKKFLNWFLKQPSCPRNKFTKHWIKLPKTTFLDFWVLESKFVKFLMSILKWKVTFPSNFTLLFIFMTHNPLQVLSSYLFYFGQEDPIKVLILTLSIALVKICHISNVFFQTTGQSVFKICTNPQCHDR